MLVQSRVGSVTVYIVIEDTQQTPKTVCADLKLLAAAFAGMVSGLTCKFGVDNRRVHAVIARYCQQIDSMAAVFGDIDAAIDAEMKNVQSQVPSSGRADPRDIDDALDRVWIG